MGWITAGKNVIYSFQAEARNRIQERPRRWVQYMEI
jgi:hypothetical protein